MVDHGLFGPRSVTWRVMGEPILLIGGFRALLMQGLHPRAMRGVLQNSSLMDPNEAWSRFVRTTEFVRVRTYGTQEEVERAGRRVRKIHATLTALTRHGRAVPPRRAGRVAVGARGRGRLLPSVARRAGVKLTDAEADTFVAEWRRAAEVVGLDPASVPGTVGELHDYIEGERPACFVPEAAHPLRLSLNAPLPLLLTPLKPVLPGVTLLAFATLPRWARRLYGLPATPVGDLWATATLRALQTGIGLAPRRSVTPGRPARPPPHGRVTSRPLLIDQASACLS